MGHSTEPIFEVYSKDRTEIPNVEQTASGSVTFNPGAVEPDDRFEGWDTLSDFLDEEREKGNEYRWLEVGVESAPTHSICSKCDATVKTNSAERIEHARSMHHISTGH